MYAWDPCQVYNEEKDDIYITVHIYVKRNTQQHYT